MDDNYPVGDAIFVLKEGARLGPFDIETLFDGLEEGEFHYDDICLREGATECERLRDILDWESTDLAGERVPRAQRSAPSRLGPGEEDESGANLFRDGDGLLYSGHPSIASSPFALFLVVGGITGGIWLYAFGLIFTAAGFALALLGMTYLSFMRFTRDYRITARRIEMITARWGAVCAVSIPRVSPVS